MPKVKQLNVTCANHPGTLAHVAKVLGDANVNIQGFLLKTSGTKGFLQFLVNNVPRAKKALDKAGIHCTEETVLMANIPNAPGALGRFAARLAAKNINITSGFQTILKGSRRAVVVLEVSRLESAVRVADDLTAHPLAEETVTNVRTGDGKDQHCHGSSEVDESCDRPAKRHCEECGYWYCRAHFSDPEWHSCAPEQGTG
jgi:hypothetical protein